MNWTERKQAIRIDRDDAEPHNKRGVPKIAKIQCPGCEEPLFIPTDILNRPIRCGDSGTPIDIQVYPLLVNLSGTIKRQRVGATGGLSASAFQCGKA